MDLYRQLHTCEPASVLDERSAGIPCVARPWHDGRAKVMQIRANIWRAKRQNEVDPTMREKVQGNCQKFPNERFEGQSGDHDHGIGRHRRRGDDERRDDCQDSQTIPVIRILGGQAAHLGLSFVLHGQEEIVDVLGRWCGAPSTCCFFPGWT